jgi:hypothetical protein
MQRGETMICLVEDKVYRVMVFQTTSGYLSFETARDEAGRFMDDIPGADWRIADTQRLNHNKVRVCIEQRS